jgi:archaellum component FlaG (FlaF/FlaG flagellin family)
MKGISTIVVMVLILMISVSLTSLGYMAFTTFFSKVTTSSEQAISQTLTNMLAQMKIESMAYANPTTSVYIRNIGKVDLTAFSAYVNDIIVPAANLQLPAGNTIPPGSVGTLTITGNLAPSGRTVKVTTAQGSVAIQVVP